MGRILRWSTVYAANWTPWSLSPDARKSGPQRQRVLRPGDGGGGVDGSGGGGGDALLLFPRCPLCETRGLIGGRTQHEGRQPLVRSSPRGVFSHPTCARTRSTPASLALSLLTPRRSFSHLFLRLLLPPSSAHLSTFNPLARSRSSARPSRS